MNGTNTAFIIVASVLVWFMTPGLAFYYGGLVSKRNVVNTMLSVFYITGLAIILWLLIGYELSFGDDIGGVIGRVRGLFMNGVNLTQVGASGLPQGAYALFQMMFAIITPALFIGAVVGRIRFRFLTWFIVLWSLLVYYPLVHLIWSPAGLLTHLHVVDFAGGTVIHVNAGVTALVLCAFLGERNAKQVQPYNRTWVLLGTAILWIGWYGFNAGSALGANMAAVTAALTTSLAAASAMCTWMVLDVERGGKPTLIGGCTGALCGLVGITPAAGYVTLFGSFMIGIIATLCSYAFINVIKPRLHVDDALDAFGCHGVSGIVGSLLTGLFATRSVNGSLPASGLFYGGGWQLVGSQLISTAASIVLAGGLTALICILLRRFIPMRVAAHDEVVGLDISEHGEVADDRSQNEVLQYPDEFIGQLGGFAPKPSHGWRQPPKSTL